MRHSVKLWTSACLVVLTSTWVTALGCDDTRRPGGANVPVRRDAADDAGLSPGEDARPAADAEPGLDAVPGAPDAPNGFPDAPGGFPDAQPMGFPDAQTVFPDAQTVFPDAQAPLDSGAPDSGLPAPVVATIAQIRTGVIPFGTNVTLRDVVVTAFHDEAARQDTVWVQDPNGGGLNSGIKVFIRGMHTASRNARVDVTGVVTDYFGETEINNATVVSRGTTFVIQPTPLTVSEAMAEEREGVLVRLTDVFSYTIPYTCSVDDATCFDSRLWEVNSGIVVYDFAFEGFEWESRTGVASVTGVMMYRYNRRRIMPRTDLDLPF
jgi:hypothetical protein